MDKQSLELLLAQGLSLEEIGKRFRKEASTVSYWVAKHGLEAAQREKHAARGGIPRDPLEELVASGASIAEIATATGRSRTNVRYWLRRWGLRTQHQRGRAMRPDVQAARDAGLLAIEMTCRHHGRTEFVLEGRGSYRCKRCRSEVVARRRRKVKAILVQEAGGRCALCGYDRCPRALEFHHLDPAQKRIEINAHGVALALETLRKEAKKCVLLCANCHAEVEAGEAILPR